MTYITVDTDGVSGDYASQSAAVAALPATFTDDITITCSASTDVDDTAQVIFTQNTTASYRLYIIGSTNYRHVSNNQTDWFRFTLGSSTNYCNITVDGINFIKTSINANYQSCISTAGFRYGLLIFKNCYILTPASTYRDRAIYITGTVGSGGVIVLANNVIISRGTAIHTGNAPIYCAIDHDVYAYNNTIKAYRGWTGVTTANLRLKNNIIKSTAAGTAVHADSDYNTFSGAFSTGGAHDRQSQTFTFTDEDNLDFHLDSDDTGAQDDGVDLSEDATYPVTTDKDGVARGTPPDCGAYEVVSTVDNTVVPSPIDVGVELGAPAVEQDVVDNTVVFASLDVGVTIGALTAQQSAPTVVIDHTAVDLFDSIPQSYIDLIKSESHWIGVLGESHSAGVRYGAQYVMDNDARFAAIISDTANPPAMPTTGYMRINRASYGDWDHTAGWRYGYGEEDWFTSAAALTATKRHIKYCSDYVFGLTMVGFGWCWDMTWTNTITTEKDPVYKCGWDGSTVNGPEGNLVWGLDAADTAITANSVCMDTYLSATREYIADCETNGYPTKVFFTTGPVDGYLGESGYQRHVKHEYIRADVNTNGGWLFDYADILAWNNAGSQNLRTWIDGESGSHQYQMIADDNLLDFDGGQTEAYGHIGQRGCLRLGKAIWVMLAMNAGWDGEPANKVTPLPVDVGITLGSPSIESLFTVTFDANGADSGTPPSPVEVEEGDSTTLPGNTGSMVKEGYVFTGWRTGATSGTRYSVGATYTPTSNVTLYTYWSDPFPQASYPREYPMEYPREYVRTYGRGG